MQRVSVHEAKTHLSRLIKRVELGKTILITSRGTPVAALYPHKKSARRIKKARKKS